MVFPENTDLAVGVAQGVAVKEEAEFGHEGDGDAYYGSELQTGLAHTFALVLEWKVAYVELVCEIASVPLSQVFARHHNQNQRNSNHQKTERDVAGILDAGFARRKPSGVDTVHCSGAQDKGEVA